MAEQEGIHLPDGSKAADKEWRGWGGRTAIAMKIARPKQVGIRYHGNAQGAVLIGAGSPCQFGSDP